jgi:hypothetical protein
MSAAASGSLTERHLTLFGAIVHGYARYELLMQRIMARAIGADGSAVILQTKTMTFIQKREALLALPRHRRVPRDQVDAIRDCLKLPSKMRTLRDDIKHSDWTAGESKDSVLPAWIFNRPTTIKALHRTPDTNSVDFMEDDDDRTEYTLDELAVIVENLAKNYAAFHDFVSETYLIEGGEDGAVQGPCRPHADGRIRLKIAMLEQVLIEKGCQLLGLAPPLLQPPIIAARFVTPSGGGDESMPPSNGPNLLNGGEQERGRQAE